jgi:hypothetical protein
MQDLVIIPTYDRPEMLWLCLEYFAACPDAQLVQIWVVVDAHVGLPPPREEIEAVVEKFPQLPVQIRYRHPHQFHGNSYNVLMAYKEAYETLHRYVFLVEDDVMIHPDFFAWHRVTHSFDGRLGCSIAVVKEPQHSHYASLGVCFRRDILRLILPHCRPAYFEHMREYCREHFPRSRVDCEQDGLFCRLLATHRVVYATTPYAQHVGWYGYHRKRSVRPYGSLEERHAQVKRALASPESLRGWMRDFWDIRPLQTPCN